MKNLKICLVLFGVALFLISLGLFIYNAFFTSGISVTNARFNLIPEGGGIFLDIYNGYDREVCLVSADVLNINGERVMLHQTVSQDGVDKMVMVSKICIPPKSTVKLQRGGYHIMVMNADLKGLDEIDVKLIFDNGDEVTVKAERVLIP